MRRGPRPTVPDAILLFGVVAGVVALLGGLFQSSTGAQGASVTLQAGGNNVVYQGDPLPVSDALSDAAADVSAVWSFDGPSQQWLLWNPTLPGPLQGFSSLQPGQAYWVEAMRTTQWTFPTTGGVGGGGAGTVSLSRGFNNVAYGGPTQAVTEALGGVASLVAAVWAFDATSQSWLLWSPALPSPLQGFTTLEAGQAYWLVAGAPGIWSQAPETFDQTVLTVYGLPDVGTWFSFVSDTGTLYTGEGTKTPLGDFDQFERLTVETGNHRFIYRYDDRGLITRLEGFDLRTGETIAANIRYSANEIAFDFFNALAAPVPVQSITIGPGEVPELDELFAQLQEGSLSFALPTRSAEMDSAGLHTAAEGDVVQLEMRVEVRDIHGRFVPGMTVEAVVFLPPGSLTASAPVANTGDGSNEAVGRFLVPLTETAEGVHTHVIPVQAPQSANTLARRCRDASSTFITAQKGQLYVLAGLGVVSLVGGAFVLGPLYAAAGLTATTIGSAMFFTDILGSGPIEGCEEVANLARAELGLQYAFEAEITESARAAGWRGIGKPDVGIPSEIDFSVTGERLLAAALIGQPLSVQVEIIVPQNLLDIDFMQEDPDAELVVGEFISFVASVTGGTPPYQVVFEGPTDSDPAPFDQPGAVAGVFNFPTAEPTTIRAIVRDGEGLRISDAINVGVEPNRPVIFPSLTGLQSVAQPFKDIFFRPSASGGAPGPYTWTITPEPVKTDVEPRLANEAAGVGTTIRFPEGGITVPVCVIVTDSDGVDSEQVCRNVEVQLQSFAGDWHSIWQCGEAREGEDFAYNWQVSLAQTDDQVGGRISFHACPGRGRIQYEVTGVVDPKSDTVTLEGVRRISLGPLGGNSPFRTTFTLLRLGEPDPNLDPVHDLAIAVTPLGTAVFVDEPIEYRVTVTNRGGDKAEDIEVRISPGGASWEFLSSPSDCETIGLLHVICQVGSLGPGQSASFFFALVPTSSGEMQTVIRVDAAGSDFIQGSNDRTVKVAVIEAP